MTFTVRDAGATRTITGGKVRIAGVDRRLLRIEGMDAGQLRLVATFADPLSVKVSPTEVFAARGSDQTITMTTGFTTATPSGGLGPYTYSWARTQGTVGVPNAPSMATTTFTGAVEPGDIQQSTFLVTVTDSAGQTATADVVATFANSGGGIIA